VSRLGVPVGGFLTYLVRTETVGPPPVSPPAARPRPSVRARPRRLPAPRWGAEGPPAPTSHPCPRVPAAPPSTHLCGPQECQRAAVEVRRRFADFEVLHRLLKAHFSGFFFPPLPQKAFFESRFFEGANSSAVKVRRVDLQVGGAGLRDCAAGAALAAARARRRRGRVRPRIFQSTCVVRWRRLPSRRRPRPPARPGAPAAARQAYMRSIVGHPVLRASEELRLFLGHPDADLSSCARWQQLVARPKSTETIKNLLSGLGLGSGDSAGGAGGGDGGGASSGGGGGGGGGGGAAAGASGGFGFRMIKMRQSLMGVVASKPKRQVVLSPEEQHLRAAKDMFRCAAAARGGGS
jgi:uncharacterized membrane protein YgcG